MSDDSTTGRILLLDVLRGVAVLGIFVVNIEIMNCMLVEQGRCYAGQDDLWNRAADEIRRLFFYSKFFPIFSLLFGLGVGMQIQRLNDRGETVWPFISRRMGGLLLIGVGHILLLWNGDVVHMYALIGLLGPLLYRMPDWGLAGLSVLLLLAFPWLGEPLHGLLSRALEAAGVGAFSTFYPAGQVSAVMVSGGYGEQIALRAVEYRANVPAIWSFFAPLALSMFGLGLLLARSGRFEDLPELSRELATPALVLALITNLYRLFFLYVVLPEGWHRLEDVGPLLLGIMPICDVSLGLFYVWLIAYVFERLQMPWLREAFGATGRMALSSYVLQSLAGLVLLSALGLGWYGQLTKWSSLWIALAFFPLQALLSWWWLRQFRYGPLEWLWRCLTYRKPLPLRRVRRR